MAFLSFLTRLFQRGKKENRSREELLWTELKVPEDTAPIEKKTLNALAGKSDPLTAQEELDAFIACGWERIKNDVYRFAVGEKPCLPGYLNRIYTAFPDEAVNLAALCFEAMPPEQRLVYLSALGKTEPEKAASEVKAMLPDLEPEMLGTVIALLGACPSAAGCEILAGFLQQEDWRLKMKAASALAEAKAVSYASAVSDAAKGCDPGVAAGLLGIAEKMKELS